MHSPSRTRQKQTVPCAIFVLALLVLWVVPSIYGRKYPLSIASVFDDVVTFGQLSRLVGFISDLGIVLWMATAALLLHGLHRCLQSSEPVTGGDYGFYLFTSGVVLFLGLDDRLLIHEWLTERWALPEALIVAVYGSVVLGGGLRFRRYFCSAPKGWIVLALAAFSVSIAVDLGVLRAMFDPMWAEVIEESAKWLGICALFLYIFLLVTEPPRASKLGIK